MRPWLTAPAGVTWAVIVSLAAPLRSAPPATAPATAPASRAADAKAILESLYGEDLRKVARTATAADDVLLAGRILEGAPNAAARPELLALLCEKVYELGSKAPAGYESAIQAMRLLGRHVPDKEPQCWEKALALLQRRYARATRFDRLEAGEYLLVVLIDRAEKMQRTGDSNEAQGLLRKALPIARAIRSPAGRDILEMQKYLLARSRFAAQAQSACARLKIQPNDRASRQAAIGLYLTELDRPDQAAALLNADVDEATRTYAPLAAKPPDQLDPNVCAELGSWYRGLAAKASDDGRLLCCRRAADFLRRGVAKLPRGSVRWMQAKLALQDAEALLAAAKDRYPLRAVTSPLRPDLLARGRARNRLPVDLQLQLLHMDLARTHKGAKIRPRFVPASDGQIHHVDLRGERGLLSLEFLAALPLTRLDLSGCRDLRGDLSALAGMPLQELSLADCSRLESLHGLESAPLTTLNLSGCAALHDAAALAGLALRDLTLSANPGIRDLEPLRGMPLTALRLSGFGGVKDLAALADAKLTSLSLEQCGVEGLDGLQGLKLQQLSLSQCPSLAGLAALKGQTGLTALQLTGCGRLESLQGLEGIALKKLSLADCTSLAGDLGALKDARLVELDLSRCAKLTSLKGLEGQPLEGLKLTGCAGIADLAALSGSHLTSLDLAGCASLASLAGIEKLPITVLSLKGCTGLPDDLAPLAGLALASLDLSGCTQLTSLGHLEDKPLRTLVLHGCSRLTGDLSALSGCPLVDLDLSFCTRLASLKGIESHRLQSLDLTGCTQLTAGDYELAAQIPTLRSFRPGSRELAKPVFAAIQARSSKPRKPRR